MPGDMVNHPPHYQQHASGVEAIEICEQLPYHLAQAMRYVLRHEHKGNPRQDLEKALWYLDRRRGDARGSREELDRFIEAERAAHGDRSIALAILALVPTMSGQSTAVSATRLIAERLREL